MPDPQPQRHALKRPRSADHRIIVRSDPTHIPDMRLLAEALLLHSTEQAAQAAGSPAPHLAGMQKLVRASTNISEEGDNE